MRSSVMTSIASVFADNPGLSSSESLKRLGLPQHSADMLKSYSAGSEALGKTAFNYEHPVVGAFDKVGKTVGGIGASLAALDISSTYGDKRAQIGEWMPGNEAFVKAGSETVADVGIPALAGYVGGNFGEEVGAAIGTAIFPGAGTVIGAAVGGAVGVSIATYLASSVMHSPEGQEAEKAIGEYAVSAYRDVKRTAPPQEAGTGQFPVGD